jgi:hypothetical protein
MRSIMHEALLWSLTGCVSHNLFGAPLPLSKAALVSASRFHTKYTYRQQGAVDAFVTASRADTYCSAHRPHILQHLES